MGVELVAHMGHSQMNIDSGMPTQFINVTYDGDPELSPVLPWLEQHRAMAQARLAEQGQNSELTEEEAQEKFMDAVGRMAPLTDTKLGLVGSIQHLHLLPDFHDRLEKAGFDVTIPIGGARLSFPGQVLGCNYSGDDPPSATIFSSEAAISIPSALCSTPASRWPCLTRTPAMQRKCRFTALNAFYASDLASS